MTDADGNALTFEPVTATLKANINQAKGVPKKIKLVKAPDLSENPYFDAELAASRAASRKARPFKFVEPGSIVKKSEKIRTIQRSQVPLNPKIAATVECLLLQWCAARGVVCCVVLCCVVLCCVVLCCVVLCCVVLCCVVLCCVVLCCVVLCCVVLRCVALRCVALRCVALCCVVLCCVVLCCVVLCCVVLWGGVGWSGVVRGGGADLFG